MFEVSQAEAGLSVMAGVGADCECGCVECGVERCLVSETPWFLSAEGKDPVSPEGPGRYLV